MTVLEMRGLDISEYLLRRQFWPKPWSLQTGEELVWRVQNTSIPKLENTDTEQITLKNTITPKNNQKS